MRPPQARARTRAASITASLTLEKSIGVRMVFMRSLYAKAARSAAQKLADEPRLLAVCTEGWGDGFRQTEN
jgi:hypothetical protein